MTGSMTGRVFNDRYKITERIGIGGMAEVYKAQDAVLGRTVAVKVMLPQYASDPNFTQRFRQEAASAANLQSPYIVNVYDWGNDSGIYFIVMEYVRGSDLKTAINQRGAINQHKVAEIGSQVCQALSVAHHQDIIHRDIKPQNIMVQPDGNVKVMDFGIARAKNSVKTRTSSVLGTAHYISPEQAQGKELTSASDIYSLGIVLYEAATGKLPFDGPDAVSVALKQVSAEPPLPSDINPRIDPDLEDIILKAMMKNPRERFATANDMRLALNDYLAGRPVNLGGFSAAETAVIGIGAGMGANAGAGVGTGMGTGMGSSSRGTAGGAGSTQVMPGGSASAKNGASNYRSGNTGSIGKQRYGGNRRGGGGTGKGNGGRDQGGSSKKVIGIVAALVAVLAVVALAAFFFLGGDEGAENPNPVEKFPVPSVAGLTLEEATKKLEDAGFVVGETDVDYDEKVETGKVISQKPKANEEREKGTKVNLVISQGTEMVKVPDLTNLTAVEAKRKLTESGLKYRAGTAQYSDDIEKDRVVAQEPLSDVEVKPGTVVEYILSLGSETVIVPNVVGQGKGAAEATLHNSDLNVTTEEVFSNDVPAGDVVSQTPKDGEKIKKGDRVHLEISKGPEPKTTFTVTATAGGGGLVTPGSATVDKGGTATFTVTANAGYAIKAIQDQHGNVYGLTDGNKVVITNVAENLDIYISFEEVAASDDQPAGGSSENPSGSEGTNSSDGSSTQGNENESGGASA